MEQRQIILFGVLIAATAGMVFAGLSTSTLFVAAPSSTLGGKGLITGHVESLVRDDQGTVKVYRQSDNLIVNKGEDCAVRTLFDTNNGGGGSCTGTIGEFSYIGIGTGATAASATQTALVTPVKRVQDTTCTFTASNAAVTNAKCLLSSTFTTGSTITVNESGIFDAATSGNMFARQLTGAIPLTSADTLTVNWTISLGDGA